MLGFVHVGQPTVFFRVSASFSVNAWTCARQSTDRDLETVSASFSVNAWTCARRSTDRDLETVSASFSVNAWTCARRSTDRDLESQRAFFVRMLGYVHLEQPTMILPMPFSLKSVTPVMSVMSVI